MMDEVIKRLDRMESMHQTLSRALHDHVTGEAITVRVYSDKLDDLSADVSDIKETLARQKGFLGGAVFAITAAGYVLVEGIKRMMGQ